MQIDFGGQSWKLLPERALLHEASKTLFIADLHLGKVQHFRKHGLALSPGAAMQDYQNLDALMKTYTPHALYILGDLFHSDHNSEWPLFKQWRSAYAGIEMTLIMGNHDIISERYYEEANLTTQQEGISFLNVGLYHHPSQEAGAGICGHVHPGIRLKGMGRQQVVLPAFAMSKQQLILPAFGSLTGLAILPKHKAWRRFAVTNAAVLEV